MLPLLAHPLAGAARPHVVLQHMRQQWASVRELSNTSQHEV